MFLKTWVKWLWRHKFIALLLLASLLAGAYFVYAKIGKAEESISYTTSTAAKGMLVSTVSASGQVSASNQVDISAKASGDITAVNIIAGQAVKEGDIIAQIDSRDAALSVREAQVSLENARADLADLLAEADDLTLLQAENSLASARDTLTKLEFSQAQDYQSALQDQTDATTNLSNSYEDAYNEMADAFLDLPGIVTGLNTVLNSYEIAESEPTVLYGRNNSALRNSVVGVGDYEDIEVIESYIEQATEYYDSARDSYDTSLADYRNVSRYSDRQVLEDLLAKTVETVKEISDALKSQTNLLDFWVDYRLDKDYGVFGVVTGYQSDLSGYIAQVNSHLSSLLSVQRDLDSAKQAIEDAQTNITELDQNQPLDLAAAQRSVKEKEENLADLLAGATDLEIKTAELAVQQKQNSLSSAQINLADYSIRAPFEGVIASVAVVRGDEVSGSTAIATLITNQKIAEVTLNEIDVTRVEVGQKVNLTFDAVEDLSVTGTVGEVDLIGTVTQGVVSYNVKIAFDVQDDRIKPGMSVSTSIIISAKQDVLLAPIGAVKTQGGVSYVEILKDGVPQRQTVSTGESNDTMIEITGGLSAGDEVITQTISSAAASANVEQGMPSQSGFGAMRALR